MEIGSCSPEMPQSPVETHLPEPQIQKDLVEFPPESEGVGCTGCTKVEWHAYDKFVLDPTKRNKLRLGHMMDKKLIRNLKRKLRRSTGEGTSVD